MATHEGQISTLWLCGLHDDDKTRFCRFFDGIFRVRTLTPDTLHDLSATRDLLITTCHGIMSLVPFCITSHQTDNQRMVNLTILENCAKILLLDDVYTPAELEETLTLDFAKVLRRTCSKADILRAVEQVHEHAFIFEDAMRLSREVLIEREILEHKSTALTFLMDFISNASASMTPADIFNDMGASFAALMPVHSIHGALWQQHGEIADVALYFSSQPGSPQRAAWRTKLIDAVQHECGDNLRFVDAQMLSIADTHSHSSPQEGHVVILPLALNGQRMGLLMLLTDTAHSLGRDCGLAVNAALRHMALTLQQALAFQAVKQHADYDALTGAYSRYILTERLTAELERSSRKKHDLCVCFLDIDHFKAINDTYGHEAGDDALRQLVSLLKTALRTYDFVARYGGEEFIIVLPDTHWQDARNIAERIRAQVAAHTFLLSGHAVSLTISIGISSYQGRQKNENDLAQTLINEADQAMYEAKRNRRNIVCVFGADTCEKNKVKKTG